MSVLPENINDYTKIKMECYQSHVTPYIEKNYKNILVNHKNDFINEQGHTTNTIDGFWSILRYNIKKTKGVYRKILTDYLFEFLWKCR